MYGSLYQTSNNGCNGSGGGGGAANTGTYRYTATGGETSIDVTTLGAGVTLTGKDVYLIRANIPQTYPAGVDYDISGNTISFAVAALAGEQFIITIFNS